MKIMLLLYQDFPTRFLNKIPPSTRLLSSTWMHILCLTFDIIGLGYYGYQYSKLLPFMDNPSIVGEGMHGNHYKK